MKQSQFLRTLLVVVLIPLLLIQFTGTVQKASAGGDPTWSANVRVNDDAGQATAQVAPSVAAYGNGNVYLAWLDLRNYPYRDIYFAKSTDGGRTWGTNVRVNDNTSPADANWPSLVVDGSGNLYLEWGDTRDGKWKSYFSKSTDGGSTWSTNVRISDQTGDAAVPILIVDNNGNLDVVWTEDRTGSYDIYFSRSIDGGLSWSPSVKINNDIGSAYQVHPKLAVDSNGKLYATWKDCRNVTWKSCNQGEMPFYDLYFAASTDNGSTWNANVRINDFAGSVWQNGPSGLTVDNSGNIYVIWDDTRDDINARSRIYFAKSGDGGVSWSANTPVSTNPIGTTEVYNYGLVVDNSGDLYAVWGDNRAGGANYDVYFASSIDGGSSWSINSKINDDITLEPQYQTTLAIDENGNLYAAWADDRSGDFDIYSSSLKQVIPNNPPSITEGDSATVTMSVNGSPTPFNLTLHATDADADTLTWSISSPASHGMASASGIGDSKVIRYIPYTDYVGSDSFVVQVDDGNGGTDTITVNVAISFYLHVRAYIDGVSRLIVKGDTVTWHHLEFDAPGRWGGNDPTYINEAEWYPTWPDIPDAANIDCDCDSSTLSGVFPALPAEDQIVTLNINQGYMVSIVQQPDASNEYTLIIEFNDSGPGGAYWYDVELLAMAKSAAGVLYATPGGIGDCSSWANACTLQSALTSAISGDEIWVAAGRYTPTTGTDRTATFQLKSGVALYGGFGGTESTRDQRNPATNVTILSGDIDNDDINTDGNFIDETIADFRGANCFHVVIASSLDSTTILDGFTITGGNATTYFDEIFGGGIGIYGGSPTLTNITFSGNVGYYGGGMFIGNESNPTLTNITFSGNLGGWGGGVFTLGSNPTFTNVTFSGNSALTYGGGMNNYGTSPTLINVTFTGNSAVNGSAIYGGEPTIRNTIVWGNTAGGGQFSESIPIIFDSVIQDGCPAGSTCTNIITADPKLGTLGNYGGFTQTVPLLVGSSAVDAGNSNYCTIGSDQRGVSYVGTCDIGAYEYEQPLNYPPVITNITAPTTPVQPGQSVNVTVEFSDPDIGDTHTVVWTWDDGSTTTESATVPSVTTSHTYTSAGVYTVTATITDAKGEATSATTQITVNSQLTSLDPAKVWIGLKNSDDVGTKFDLLAEVYQNSTLVGSGQFDKVNGGSSGFNNAKLNTIPLTLFVPIDWPQGSTLSLKLYVRNTCFGNTHNSGTARLWYNDASANSQFGAAIDDLSRSYFLREGFTLSDAPGSGPRKTVDVAAGRPCSAFKLFGTWSIVP